MAIFTNQASLSYNGITTTSNVVTGEVTEAVTMQKNAVSGSYRQGDTVTYSISLQNASDADVTGLTVTDDLGATAFGAGTVTPLTYDNTGVLYYENGVLQAAPTVTAGPPLTIGGINVPANGNTVVVYRAVVNSFAPVEADATVNNTATLSGGGLTEAVTADAAITADTAPLLSILKALNPTTVVDNGEITYTFTIQNTGVTEADAATNLIVSDTFNPVLETPLTVTLNGASLVQTGNYTYNAATGAFSTVAGAITVPAATYTQNPTTGEYLLTPGTTVLTVTGRV